MTAAIGKAVIEVLADASKFESSVEKSGGIKGALSSIGRKVKTGLKVSFAAAGALAAGALSTALVKGFSRLKAIDDAKAKLRGLGNTSVEISGIMDDALKAVSGTAFGMGEAASTAANLLASGVKPGKELSDTLALVGDTATIAGAGLGEIGGVFQKIKTGNKLTTETLQQLQDKGIPVLKFLADKYKITQVAAQEMVTKGKVNFEDFADAIKTNIGGAALESGKSFTGALKNVGAALGRLGAKMLTGVFDQLPDLFGGAITSLDTLGAGAARIGEVVGKAFARMVSGAGDAVSAAKPMFESIRAGATELGGQIKTGLANALTSVKAEAPSLRSALAAALVLPPSAADSWSAFGKSAVDKLKGIGANIWDVLGPAFDDTVTKLRAIWDNLWSAAKSAVEPILSIISTFGGILMDAFGAIGDSGLSVWGLLLSAVEKVSEFIKANLAPALEAVAGFMERNRTAITGLVVGLLAYKGAMLAVSVATKIVSAVTAGYTAIQKLLNGAMSINPIFLIIAAIAALVAGFLYLWKNSESFRNFWIGLWAAIRAAVQPVIDWFTTNVVPLLEAAWAAIKVGAQIMGDILVGIWNAIKDNIGAVVSGIGTFLSGAWEAISGVLLAAWDAIRGVIEGALSIITGIFDVFVGLFTGNWSALWDGVKAIVSGVWKIITSIFSGAISAISAVVSGGFKAISGLITVVLNGIKAFISAVWSTLGTITSTAWNAIKNFVMTPVNALASAVKAVVSGISKAISAAWNGIKSVTSTVWNAIKSAITIAITAVKTAISTVTGAIGRAWSSFWDGLKKVATDVFDAVAGLAGGIWDGITGGLKAALNGAIGLLNSAIGFINSKLIDTANKVPFVSIPHIPSIPRLAKGGAAEAFKPYIVGELGPELFVPRKQGTVIPNDRLGSPQAAVNNDGVVSELRALRNDVVTLRAVIAGLPMDAHVLERSA